MFAKLYEIPGTADYGFQCYRADAGEYAQITTVHATVAASDITQPPGIQNCAVRLPSDKPA
jgi:hypothetical protein